MPALTLTLNVKVLLEVFSGSGNFGKAAAAEGFLVLAWGILLGPEDALLVASNQRLVIGWARAGLLEGC